MATSNVHLANGRIRNGIRVVKVTTTILSVAVTIVASAAVPALAFLSAHSPIAMQCTRTRSSLLSPHNQCTHGSATATTPLYMNIPAPTTEGGATPEEIKDAADREAPPSSFYELQRASVRAAKNAIRDGHRLLEIEVSFSCAQICSLFLLTSFRKIGDESYERAAFSLMFSMSKI